MRGRLVGDRDRVARLVLLARARHPRRRPAVPRAGSGPRRGARRPADDRGRAPVRRERGIAEAERARAGFPTVVGGPVRRRVGLATGIERQVGERRLAPSRGGVFVDQWEAAHPTAGGDRVGVGAGVCEAPGMERRRLLARPGGVELRRRAGRRGVGDAREGRARDRGRRSRRGRRTPMGRVGLSRRRAQVAPSLSVLLPFTAPRGQVGRGVRTRVLVGVKRRRWEGVALRCGDGRRRSSGVEAIVRVDRAGGRGGRGVCVEAVVVERGPARVVARGGRHGVQGRVGDRDPSSLRVEAGLGGSRLARQRVWGVGRARSVLLTGSPGRGPGKGGRRMRPAAGPLNAEPKKLGPAVCVAG